MKTFVVVGAVALAGCGDDGSGLDGDDLTEVEAAALAGAILDVSLGESFEAIAGGGGPAAVPIDISESINVTPPCPAGGSVGMAMELDGTVDSETGTGDVSFVVTATHQSCGVNSEGFAWVLDGDPNVSMDFDISIGTSQIQFDGSYSGVVAWELNGDASGTCSIDVSFSGTETTGSVAGSVCGISVDDSFSG